MWCTYWANHSVPPPLEAMEEESVNDVMLREGLAYAYDGGTKKAFKEGKEKENDSRI